MKDFSPCAILLDFYGTVVEEDETYGDRIFEEVSRVSRLGVEASDIASLWNYLFFEMCDQSLGASFRLQKELTLISLQQVLNHFEADLDSEALCQPEFEYWAHPDIFPESKEVLERCRIPICLVSNIDNAELQLALNYHNLSFHQVVTSEDCRAYKPRREVFQRALSVLDLSPEEVLHVGDSLSSDVEGAQSLGIPVLWINRKQRELSSVDKAPDYVSADLTGLLDLVG
ncbi:MAG: HAD family hydrolase [Dehalococcoidales bacterium]|nr:MAG: HAD family hydrolase [Dehalococcoidales bacterium]